MAAPKASPSSERTVATDTGPVPAISQVSSASARPPLERLIGDQDDDLGVGTTGAARFGCGRGGNGGIARVFAGILGLIAAHRGPSRGIAITGAGIVGGHRAPGHLGQGVGPVGLA
jgi:hypothetical protein